MRRPGMRNAERGYSLLVAIVVVVFLSALAAITIRTVTSESRVAGDERASQQALYLAQAGIAWGTDMLRRPPYNLDGSGTIDSVLADPSLRTVTVTTDVFYDATRPWRELPGSPVSYQGGTFRVAIRDDKDSDPTVDKNGLFQMRALGTDQSGSRRMIEVVLLGPLPQP